MSYMTLSATIATSGLDQSADGSFLRIEDKRPGDIPDEYEDELTQGEVVDIFASIFGRGSCGAADDPDAYAGPEEGELPQESVTSFLQEKYPGIEGAQQLAAEFGIGDMCRPETLDGGEIYKKIYVHASSQDIFDQYTLVSHDAELDGKRFVDADIYLKIEFSDTPSAPIYYFVDQKRLSNYLSNALTRSDVYEWRGVVKDADGETIDNPTWTYSNGSVHFPGNWSGILVFKMLPIHYHLFNLTIKGIVDSEATRHYDARVSGKAPGLAIVNLDIAEETTADETEKDCPWLEIEKALNPTSGMFELKCGKCVEYGDDDAPEEPPAEPPKCYDTITAEEYNAECCGGPLPGCLPDCLRTEKIIQGPVGTEEDIPVGIVLMPEDGVPCGTLITTYESSGSCDECGDLVDLVWSVGNPEIIAPGGSIVLEVTGGDPVKKPITWSLQGAGTGYTLTGGGSSYINGRSVDLFASLDVCGPITVKADDSCSNTSGDVEHTGGVEFTVEYLDLLPGNYLRVDIINGSPTYDWSVIGQLTIISGGGPTSTYAYVQLNSDACDGGSVEVTDACNSISLPVNNIKPPVSFTASSLDILPGAWERAYTANGRAPYDWSVTGPLTIIGGGTSTSYYADVKLDAGACDGGSVSVTDLCNSASIPVNNTVQPIYLTGTKTTLCTNETARCYAYDGQLPYTWSVTGGLVIIAGGTPTSTFCDVRNTGGGGDVQISDACGSDSYTFAQTESC